MDVEAKAFGELLFQDDYFDVVTLWQVLEHVLYPLMFVGDVHRIPRPRGWLATSIPDIEGILARMLRRRWCNLRRLHTNRFTPETFADMVSRTGFKNVFAAGYNEYIDLSMLAIALPKHLKVYERAEGLFHPSSTSGRIMDRLRFAYSSELNSYTLIGFK